MQGYTWTHLSICWVKMAKAGAFHTKATNGTTASTANTPNHSRQEKNKDTAKSLSEALLFAGHGENMLCTKIVLNVRNDFSIKHVLPRLELGIFIY